MTMNTEKMVKILKSLRGSHNVICVILWLMMVADYTMSEENDWKPHFDPACLSNCTWEVRNIII